MYSAWGSAIHMLGLALTLGSIFMRARYFRQPLDKPGLNRLFIADSAWGLSAIVMIGCGLWRALGGLEKGWDYYGASHTFWTKMGLLVCILLLELWPMITLINWRIASAKGRTPDTSKARVFAIFSDVQTLSAMLMVFAAAFMARGR